jgi:hypothetical protein
MEDYALLFGFLAGLSLIAPVAIGLSTGNKLSRRQFWQRPVTTLCLIVLLASSVVLPFVTPEPAMSYLPGYWLVAVVHLYYLLWAFSVSLMVNAAINRKLGARRTQTRP